MKRTAYKSRGRRVSANIDLDDAACEGLAPLFDDEVYGESWHQQYERHKSAVKVCRSCPIQSKCLAHALSRNGRDAGIYGGLYFSETYKDGVEIYRRHAAKGRQKLVAS